MGLQGIGNVANWGWAAGDGGADGGSRLSDAALQELSHLAQDEQNQQQVLIFLFSLDYAAATLV